MTDAAFEFVSPLDFPELADDAPIPELPASEVAGVQVVAPGEIRRFHRRAAEFHDDPDGAKLFAAISPASVLSGPVFTVAARDVRLVGYRTLLTSDGRCFNDEAPSSDQARQIHVQRLSMPDTFPNEETGLRPTCCPGWFRLEQGCRRVVRIEAPIVLLASHEPSNYGSFLFRVLPKIIEHLGADDAWRFMFWAEPSAHRGLLNLLGIPDDRIVRHDTQSIYELDHVVMPCLRNPSGFLDPETVQFYSDMRVAFGADGARPSAKRIYISRLGHNQATAVGRVMRNEALLVERLRAEGFTIVEPQMLSPAEQIGLFAGADLVVGPSGAGMFNAVFCRPGTRLIDIESEPHWIWCHSCLFSSAGLRYSIFEGLAADQDWSGGAHKPFSVNIPALMERIQAFQ